MNLDPITPYQMKKNLENLQRQYEELLERVENLTKMADELEKRLGEEK